MTNTTPTPSTPEGEDQPPDDPAVPRSIGRLLDVLEIVLSKHSCNLTSAATTSGLTPTTALRYLRALEVLSLIHISEPTRPY